MNRRNESTVVIVVEVGADQVGGVGRPFVLR